MADTSQTSVTMLLSELQSGNLDAVDKLFERVYETLRAMARDQRSGWKGDNTMNTTALVHEVYLKLVDEEAPSMESRAHFLNVAAKVMRHILIDHARGRQALKRGGDIQKQSLDEALSLPFEGTAIDDDRALDLIQLDDALTRLASLNEREALVVECRFFAGMSIAETALVLGVSDMTVKRDWTMARAWLKREMTAA